MEKISKRISWISIASLVSILLGIIFGLLTSKELENDLPKFQKWFLGIVLIIGIIMILVTVVSFLQMRQGNVKASILATGKYTRIQLLAPTLCMILAIVGLVAVASKEDKKINSNAIVFIVVTYFVLVFSYGFNSRGLKAYRKDKESYGYISITAFITAAAIIIFTIGAVIGMAKIPAKEGSHIVGYLEACCIFFTITDLFAYVSLGLLALFANKYAPKVTMADVDGQVLTSIGEKLDNLSNKETISNEVSTDRYSKLRELKQLLDDGVISEEEFAAEKKKVLQEE